MGRGHQRKWQQAATQSSLPPAGGVAYVGTAGAPLCSAEQKFVGLDAPSVPMRHTGR